MIAPARILVPTDFGETSVLALRYGRELARTFGSALHVLHAISDLVTLQTLPPKHVEILVMRELDGFSYEELAQALGIPKGTVMSRLFHARAALQKVLLTQGVTLEDVT